LNAFIREEREEGDSNIYAHKDAVAQDRQSTALCSWSEHGNISPIDLATFAGLYD
jgi:hypothetical protein